MHPIKKSFIELALDATVIQFGKFKLKSGRISPYFFDAGLFYQGDELHQIGQFYADILLKNQVKCDHLFGPAYKGITLATSTAIALAQSGKTITVTFNRKEAKNHGEGGQIIGGPLTGKTVLIDDVITSGKTFREAQALIKAQGGQLTTMIVALDRCERGETKESALAEITREGVEVFSIITLIDLIEHLNAMGRKHEADSLIDYHKEYGDSASRQTK